MGKQIAVIFGGRSCEHEISILSALQVMHALQDKYDVIPIYISKQDEMYSAPYLMELSSFQDMNRILKSDNLISLKRKGKEVYVQRKWRKDIRIDFVFPVMHGTNGEDGAIQGYLEILHVPYAGTSILGASLAQSKSISKQLLMYHGIATLEFDIINENQKESAYLPCIIKPSHLGSSIGIQVAHTKQEYYQGIENALHYDEECIVEPYIASFHEMNCSVKQTKEGIEVSCLEEVFKQDGILSFEDKYASKGTKEGVNGRVINPAVDTLVETQIKEIAKQIYRAFHLDGVIRIDFMVVENKVYVNEINTIPGSYAYYLWPKQDMLSLLEECMQVAIKKYRNEEMRITSFASDVLFHYDGTKANK